MNQSHTTIGRFLGVLLAPGIVAVCGGGTDSAPISLAARLIDAIGYVKASNTAGR
jgi:hypothetical protein